MEQQPGQSDTLSSIASRFSVGVSGNTWKCTREIWTVYLVLPLSLISNKNFLVLSSHRSSSRTEQPQILPAGEHRYQRQNTAANASNTHQLYKMFNCDRMFIFISISLSFWLEHFFLCLMKNDLLYSDFFSSFCSFFNSWTCLKKLLSLSVV